MMSCPVPCAAQIADSLTYTDNEKTPAALAIAMPMPASTEVMRCSLGRYMYINTINYLITLNIVYARVIIVSIIRNLLIV